jgi:RNA polymerase sigma-70 factor (ECF subfamily)
VNQTLMAERVDAPRMQRDEQELTRLLARVGEGDPEATREVFLRWRPMVARLLSGFDQLDRDDVEDLVQETFMRAFAAVKRLRRADTFEGWLLAIARNRALTIIARRERGHASLNRYIEATDDSVDFLPTWVREEFEQHLVRQLIDELPEGAEKTTATLFDVDGRYSAREIGERLSVGKSTITMRLDRFRDRMRRRLAHRVLRSRWEP